MTIAEHEILTQERPRDALLPRSFQHVVSLSYGRSGTGNFVIQGENLHVLTNLRQMLEGTVRCIYIDPPYNNQERYRHYEDRGGHDEWLEMMSARLQALKPLLSGDGSIWISIDDGEVHYLKVIADRIFGRANFITTIVWEHRTTRENRSAFSKNHEYLLVYGADPQEFRRRRNLLPHGRDQLARYKNPDNDPRGPWQSVSATVQDGHATPSQFYDLVAPTGKLHTPPRGRCWVYSRDRMLAEIAAQNVWFGPRGEGVPRLKQFLSGAHRGLTPDTLWKADAVGTTDEAKKHILEIFPDDVVFETPKPERLIARVLQIATNPGDLVLDAFLGSGTTSAVAHRLGRRHIGIESGLHAASMCAARLRDAIDREARAALETDLSTAGGFDFYLAC